MLGFILLYFLARPFFTLAEKHERSKWGYAILSVVVFYAGTSAFGLLFGFGLEMNSPGALDEMNENVIGLICMPAGLAALYFLYEYLKRTWSHAGRPTRGRDDIIDDDLWREA